MNLEVRFEPGDMVAFFPSLYFTTMPVYTRINEIRLVTGGALVYVLAYEDREVGEGDLFEDYAEAYKFRIAFLNERLKELE